MWAKRSRRHTKTTRWPRSPNVRVYAYVRTPVLRAMSNVAAHAPYTIDMGAGCAAASQPPRNGTRLGRWDNTRSMTTFKGQGRSTVNAASSTIATVAQPNASRYGRRRGSTSRSQTPNEGRSEERRVGKECRARGSRNDEKK